MSHYTIPRSKGDVESQQWTTVELPHFKIGTTTFGFNAGTGGLSLEIGDATAHAKSTSQYDYP